MRRTNHSVNSFLRSISLLLTYLLFVSPVSMAPTKGTAPVPRRKTAKRRTTQQVVNNIPRREGQLLVHFKPRISDSILTSAVEGNGAHRGRWLRSRLRVQLLTVASGHNQDVVMAGLAADPNVDYVEPNYIISQDSTGQSSAVTGRLVSSNNAVNAPGVIKAPQIPANSISSRAIIALIDSGVDFTHPDLQKHEWLNRAERSDGLDHDGD